MAATDLVTLSDVKTALNISVTDYDSRLSALIINVSARIVTYLNVPVVYESATEKHFGGKKRIYLKKYPYVSGMTIADGQGNTIPSTDYLIIAEQGILQHVWLWPIAQEADGKIGRWSMTFLAGLAATTADVPADIKQACLLLVAMHFNRPDQSVTIKSVGDMQLSYRDAPSSEQAYGLPPEIAALLSPYVSWRF